MSWDFLLTRSGNDLPDGDLAPIGSPSEIASKLAAQFPDIDYIDAEWLSLHRADWLIEINVGSIDPVLAIELSARGSEDVIPVVRTLADTLDCEAFDVGSGKDVDDDTETSRQVAQDGPEPAQRDRDDPGDGADTVRSSDSGDEADDAPSGTPHVGASDESNLRPGQDEGPKRRGWLSRLLHRG